MEDGLKAYKSATLAFQKLNPSKGNVIVITFPADIIPEQMQVFANELQPNVPEDVTVICTRLGITIEELPETQMNKFGWYKFDMSKVN